jgi:hypothetical protein
VQNYYQLLNIKPTATDSDIKKAYRQLAIKYHPDSGINSSSTQHFEAVTEAYKNLIDPDKRRQYDYLLFYKDRVDKSKVYRKGHEKKIRVSPIEDIDEDTRIASSFSELLQQVKQSKTLDFLSKFMINYAPILGLLYLVKFQNYLLLVPITLLCNFVFLVDENSIKEESKDTLFILRGVLLAATVALISYTILNRFGFYNKNLIIFLVGISAIFSGFANRAVFDLRALKLIVFTLILVVSYSFLPSRS